MISILLLLLVSNSSLMPDLTRPQRRGCFMSSVENQWRTVVYADYLDDHKHDSTKPEGHTYADPERPRQHCWAVLYSAQKDGKKAARDCFEWLDEMKRETEKIRKEKK